MSKDIISKSMNLSMTFIPCSTAVAVDNRHRIPCGNVARQAMAVSDNNNMYPTYLNANFVAAARDPYPHPDAAKKDISQRYTLQSITDGNLGNGEKPDWAVVKATISFIK